MDAIGIMVVKMTSKWPCEVMVWFPKDLNQAYSESDATGIWLTDGSGYSTCVRLVSFNNTEGTFISQNPPNNGACYSGDSFKGKYFKGLFFKSTFNGKEVYWTCTIFDAKDSIAAAKEVADNTDRSTPESSGCGGSSWSRLEQVSNQ